MEYILTANEMKLCDNYTSKQLGVPSIVLMERAALSVLEVLKEHELPLSHVLVVCGSGNNGGDGFAISRLLKENGINVEVLFAGNEASCTKLTKEQWRIADNYGIEINRTLKSTAYTTVIDALFGIGLNREITGNAKNIISSINNLKQQGAKTVAVDIASGIYADSGKIMGIAVEADYTVTFAYKKRGQLLYPGASYTGILVLKDIGISNLSLQGSMKDLPKVTMLNSTDLIFPKRPVYSNKGTFGKALLITGSEEMPGAAILAAKACMKSGTGMVQVFTHEKNRDILIESIPEVIVTTYADDYEDKKLKKAIGWADVIGIGPGISLGAVAEQMVYKILTDTHKPLVMDADAITIAAKHRKMFLQQNDRDLIMTPHIGEFCRFMANDKHVVLEDILAAASRMSIEYHVVCVCKDTRTVITDSCGNTRINIGGNSGMASAGTGDVLFGIICGLLAQGMSAFDAASYGAFLHATAGNRAAALYGEHGMLAGNLIECMKEYLDHIQNE